MKLQTKIPLSRSGASIDYNSKILLVGSCFAENLSNKLAHNRFQQFANPLGILFHPLAIVNFFQRVLDQREFRNTDLVFHQDRWHSLEAHSSLSGAAPGQVVKELNEALQNTYKYLSEATHLFITLGTAWGYRHTQRDVLVANCHKIPQREFSKELTKNALISSEFQSVFNRLWELNPGLPIVCTVSPVRHLKDGFVENQRSKSELFCAVHQLVEDNKQIDYFPSYEIMMDELRDYRFYKEDMVHPNAQAVNYIWEKFTEVYLSPEASLDLKTVEEILRGHAHRPFAPNSESHQRFLVRLRQKEENLQKRLPHINFNGL